MSKNQTKVVATRVTWKLAELIQEFCRRDAHVNPADFIRDAIREKLAKDGPELYRQMYGSDARVMADLKHRAKAEAEQK